jgi:hypothetical protein
MLLYLLKPNFTRTATCLFCNIAPCWNSPHLVILRSSHREPSTFRLTPELRPCFSAISANCNINISCREDKSYGLIGFEGSKSSLVALKQRIDLSFRVNGLYNIHDARPFEVATNLYFKFV